MQNFITITNAPELNFLAQDLNTPGPTVAPDEVRGDSEVSFSIQPVVENPAISGFPYSPDYINTDVLTMGIGNYDTPPSGGSVALQANTSTSGLTAIPSNVSAAALTSALNIAIAAGGGGSAGALCSVTLITPGNYLIVGTTNTAVASGFFAVTSAALLVPFSTASFYEQTLGSASTPYRILLVMVQQAMCFAEATDDLGDATAVIDLVQNWTSTANKIQTIRFSDFSYGGSATLAATINSVTASCGTITPTMTIAQIGTVLRNHPEIIYNNANSTDPNNIFITQLSQGVWNVEILASEIAGDNANTLTISNSNVIGAQGKSGTINYNTIELYLYSLTQPGFSFQLKRQIQRSRANGEVRTIYIDTVTIDKNILNINTAVPTPLPSFYTKTESDTRFLRRDASSSTTGIITVTIASDGTLAIASGGTITIGGSAVIGGTLSGSPNGSLNFQGVDFTLPSIAKIVPVHVSALPSAGAANAFAMVDDADTPIAGQPVVGGGGVIVPVFSNGADWVVMVTI